VRGEGQRGGTVNRSIGTDSEVGRLRTALVHRPGQELARISPRTRERLRFDTVPWIARAQQEHDLFTDALREHGVEVVYLTELLQDVLEYQAARDEAIGSVLAESALGEELAASVSRHLASLPPEDLARVLISGLTPGDLRTGHGLVYELLDPHDFVVEPLPSLVFVNDTSIWIGDQPVLCSLSGPRRRESWLSLVIYRHHPRFAELASPFPAGPAGFDGGDVLLLAAGVVAVGVGARTAAASLERLAKHLLETGIAHTVLAVPAGQRGQDRTLDMTCTMADSGVVVMAPSAAFTLTAMTVTARWGELRISRPRPFLEAAAGAIGADSLTVIETGLDSAASASCQWDDGGNSLAIGDRVMICDERNVQTNARLTAAGFDVVTVPASELGRTRGGPRSMCAPVFREPARLPERRPTASQPDKSLGLWRSDGPPPAHADTGTAPARPAPDRAEPAGDERRDDELAPVR